jgi:hypothetical protein
VRTTTGHNTPTARNSAQWQTQWIITQNRVCGINISTSLILRVKSMAGGGKNGRRSLWLQIGLAEIASAPSAQPSSSNDNSPAIDAG